LVPPSTPLVGVPAHGPWVDGAQLPDWVWNANRGGGDCEADRASRLGELLRPRATGPGWEIGPNPGSPALICKAATRNGFTKPIGKGAKGQAMPVLIGESARGGAAVGTVCVGGGGERVGPALACQVEGGAVHWCPNEMDGISGCGCGGVSDAPASCVRVWSPSRVSRRPPCVTAPSCASARGGEHHAACES
jgi:hypothetical protein